MNRLILNSVFRTDPTRTLTLRRQFTAEVNRRLGALKKEITTAIVDNDVFGLEEPKFLASQPRQFNFPTSDQKIEEFMEWLKEQEANGILEVIDRPRIGGGTKTAWSDKFILSGYQRGVVRAQQELRKQGRPAPPTPPAFPQEQAISAFLTQPYHADRLAMMYTRVFSELKGVTEAMNQQISRVLTEQFAQGVNPRQIARVLVDRVDKIGIVRARTIARTEVIRAHAQAHLQEARIWGVQGVRVQAEFSTAGFRVCDRCSSLEGRTYTLDEAEGLIPVHPNCRCVFLFEEVNK